MFFLLPKNLLSSLRSVFHFVLKFSELPLIFLKISIFVSKLEKASVVYNPQTLPNTKAIPMRIVK